MAVVHTDLSRYENLVRKSIQIPSTQHKELKALAVELDSSLGDVVETIMDLMRQDNYQQLKSAILQKRERELSPSTIPSMKPTPTSDQSQKPLQMPASFLMSDMQVCLHEQRGQASIAQPKTAGCVCIFSES